MARGRTLNGPKAATAPSFNDRVGAMKQLISLHGGTQKKSNECGKKSCKNVDIFGDDEQFILILEVNRVV